MASHPAPADGAVARGVGPAPSGLACAAAAGAWLACLFTLVLGFAIVRGWHLGETTSVTRLGRQLIPNAATAQSIRLLGGSLQLSGTGTRPALLDLTISPFQAAEAGLVAVDTGPLPDGAQLALLWVRRSDPGVIHEQVLKLDHGQVAPTILTQNAEWRGEIVSAALGVKNPTAQPVLIGEVRLRPVDVAAVLTDLLSDWMYTGGWDGRSINVAFGGREEQPMYLPLLSFIAAALAAGIAAITHRRRGRRASVAWLVVPFIASWMLLDLRWQRELMVQARATHDAFAGKTLAEREAAMENPAFFALVDAARKRLPVEPVRVFTTSDFEYFRLRAGYYLYPHNVLAFDWEDPSVLRRGDYLLLFAKSGITFDAATATLTWSDGRRVAAKALIPGQGQGLYRIG